MHSQSSLWCLKPRKDFGLTILLANSQCTMRTTTIHRRLIRQVITTSTFLQNRLCHCWLPRSLKFVKQLKNVTTEDCHHHLRRCLKSVALANIMTTIRIMITILPELKNLILKLINEEHLDEFLVQHHQAAPIQLRMKRQLCTLTTFITSHDYASDYFAYRSV